MVLTHMLSINSNFLIAGVSMTVLVVFLMLRRVRKHEKLPPGPPLDPVIGGVRTMPASYPWLTFAEWAPKWGDVIYTTLFGSPIIVLNSAEAARDLMDKKGSNYSDRPRAVVWNEILEWDTIATMPYGDRFRKHRRLISQVLNSQAVMAYHGLQMNSSKELLKNLLANPEDFEQHIERGAFTSLVRVTYGFDIAPNDNSLISLFADAMRRTNSEGAPGACPIDLFPFLKYIPSWIPGVKYQKRLREAYGYVEGMKNVPYMMLQAERQSGVAKPSMMSELLDDHDPAVTKDAEHERDLKLVGGIILGGGVETTATTMLNFFQLMAKHQGVVKQAQSEIDIITRQERLPTLDDRKNIPFIDCIMREVFRAHAPAPLSVPHASMEEDTYRSMRIPAGSTIIPNIWQMMRDERYFKDPNVFNPERFREKVISLNGNSIKALNGLDNDDPISLVYGNGRRICPGRYFVDNNLWLMMSNILAVFDIGPPLDAYGAPKVIGDIEFTDGLTSRVKPFKCTIRPRNERCAALIKGLEPDDTN